MAGADFDSIGRPREIPFDTAENFLLTVPADRLFEIYAIAFVWTATATVGTRLITVRIRNRNSDVLFQRRSKRDQVATEAIRYIWAPGMPDETDVSFDNQILQPMPLLQIQETGDVFIEDTAGIQALDTLVGSISIREYKAD